MKYNEQYLLNLSLQLMRQIEITHFDVLCNKHDCSQGWKHITSFYSHVCKFGPSKMKSLPSTVAKMNAATRGSIMALGISTETPYRSLTLDRVIQSEDLLDFCGGDHLLTDYATAVIAGCMWEMLIAERVCRFGDEAFGQGENPPIRPKMREFVMAYVTKGETSRSMRMQVT